MNLPAQERERFVPFSFKTEITQFAKTVLTVRWEHGSINENTQHIVIKKKKKAQNVVKKVCDIHIFQINEGRRTEYGIK